MDSSSEELLERAISAMLAGIEIYNKPGFPYRAESFAILAINGWELLLKAKWLYDNQNQMESLYVTEKDGSIKKTRSNAARTHGLDYIAKKFVADKVLNSLAWDNIQLLLEIRDSSIHFYNKSSIRTSIYGISAACVKNFATAVRNWFNKDLSEYDISLMPLAFIDIPQNADGIVLSPSEHNFLSFLESIGNSEYDSESPYAVIVNVDVKFTKSNDADSLDVRITTDPSALSVRLTEEQIREKYPWDYNELTQRCRNRYQDFKVNKEYHTIRKAYEGDQKFAITRFLDPGNPRSPKKPFFNPNILRELDKHYSRKPQ